MKAFAAAGAVILLSASSAYADQCRVDADCEAGRCAGGACVDFDKRDRQLLEDAQREGVIDDARKYTVAERRYWPVVWAGAGVFAASWIGTIVAVAATEGGGQPLALAFVPVVGPILMDSADVVPDGIDGLHVGLAAAQGAGVLAAIVGLTIETKVLEPAGAKDVSFAPVIAPGFAGVCGSF